MIRTTYIRVNQRKPLQIGAMLLTTARRNGSRLALSCMRRHHCRVNNMQRVFPMSATRVILDTTMGPITIELDEENAPETTANFIEYVEADFYTGTLFHRVIDGFMVQGGGLDANMKNKATRAPIKNEANNGLSNETATVAMARTSDPHSATAQFFINVEDNDFLNHKNETPEGWGYCVFGRVVNGMDVVNSIKGVPTTSHGPMRDVPADPIEITSAVIERD